MDEKELNIADFNFVNFLTYFVPGTNLPKALELRHKVSGEIREQVIAELKAYMIIKADPAVSLRMVDIINDYVQEKNIQ